MTPVRIVDGQRAQPGSLRESRYTRRVSWRQRTAIFVLLVLAGLPVGETVCGMMCRAASMAAASRHGSGQPCDEPAGSSSAPQMSAASHLGCNTHDTAIRQVATRVERADLDVTAAPPSIGTAHPEVAHAAGTGSTSDYAAPPGTAPPATHVVLRV